MKIFLNRKIYLVILFFLAFLFITGCEDDPTEPETQLVIDQKLVGTWELTKIKTALAGQPIELTPEVAGIASTVTFNGDLSFHSTSTDSDGTTEDTGTWGTLSGNLTIHRDGNEPETSPYVFIDNDNVSIEQNVEIGGSEVLATLVFTKKY